MDTHIQIKHVTVSITSSRIKFKQNLPENHGYHRKWKRQLCGQVLDQICNVHFERYGPRIPFSIPDLRVYNSDLRMAAVSQEVT